MIMFLCHTWLIASNDEPVLLDNKKNTPHTNQTVTIRIVNKVTGKVQDIEFSKKQPVIETSSLKIQYKDAFTERVTPSTKITWVFLEIWNKDAECAEDEWALQYSNWLCNLDNRFSNKDWGVHILDVKTLESLKE